MLDLEPHKDNLESRLYNEFRDGKDQRKVRDREGKDDRLGILQQDQPTRPEGLSERSVNQVLITYLLSLIKRTFTSEASCTI